MTAHGRPKVVVLGGGTGMPILLRGLKQYPIDLSTIVTVADDGGSTGRLRQDMETPAPGDIRNVIAALANVDEELLKLFQHRFQLPEGMEDHSLGNLILVALSSLTGDFFSAVQQLSKLLQVEANIYPIVNESVVLHAEMEDGTIVSGESNIPLKNKQIKRVFLTPNNLRPMPEVIKCVQEADLIVISPGSLYTSILPNLIIAEVEKALSETKAQKVYVCNIMTQRGETEHYSAADHVNAIFSHVGKQAIDTIIVHDEPIVDESLLAVYEFDHSFPVTYGVDELRALDIHVIEENLIDVSKGIIRHNTAKLAKLLYDMAQNTR